MFNEEPIYIARGRLEADMIRILLESEGLHPELLQESAGAVYGLTIGALGEVKIYVPENEIAHAKQILEAMEDGEMVLPEDADLEASGSDADPEEEN